VQKEATSVSIEKKAARGVAWNMATGVGTRVVGLIGTLVLTRFIAPAEYGDVSAAAICVLSANQLMFFAFGQYIIANKSPAEVAFQAAALNLGLGVVATLGVFLLRGPLGVVLEAPDMGRFIPGFAAAAVIDRLRMVPTSLLVRDLRFRAVAIVNSVGELTFTGTAVALAPRFGGYAVMAGALARSAITCILFIAAAPRPEWLKRSPFQRGVVRHLFGYGAPIMLSSVADRAASTWDNLIVLRLFGESVMGAYALSYSLAETPLIYVAERMGDVLMPAFSKMEPDERPAAVVRAAGLMALVVAPLGVGVGAVAPTIVRVFFDVRWSGMASILMVLSVMTVFQPVPWSAVAYLQAEKMTRPIMVMSIARTILLLLLVAVLGWLGGPVWACAGVGVGYAVHSVLMVMLTARFTPLSARRYFAKILGPLLACVPMFVGVAALRTFAAERGIPAALSLAAEIVCGGCVYAGAALVLAGPNVRELIRLIRPAPSPTEGP
jgi:PST family polysaccharide transporter